MSKKNHYVWVHTKDGRTFEANVEKVGAEAGFYDVDGDTSVDRRITEGENDLAPFLRELIATEGPCLQPGEQISGLIWHLAARPRSFRTSFEKATHDVADIVGDALGNPDNLEFMLLKEVNENRQHHAQYAEEEIRRQFPAATDEQVRTITDLIFSLAPDHLSRNKEALSDQFRTLVPFLKEGFTTSSRKGHVEALAIERPSAIERFSKFNFQVRTFPHHSLVLGDCGPIGFDRCMVAKRVIGQDAAVVCLPLSGSKLLIGCPAETAEVEVSVHDANKASAAVSSEFFVSAVQDDGEGFAKIIGTQADLWDTEDRKKTREKFLYERAGYRAPYKKL